MNEDIDTARRRIITEMLPGEQAELVKAADKLAELCREPHRIRQALAGRCRWSYCCAREVIGYYESGSRRGGYVDYRGICAAHKPDAAAAEIHVYDPPAQVQL